MERSQLFDLMDELQPNGMKAAFDEIMANAKRQHDPSASSAICSPPGSSRSRGKIHPAIAIARHCICAGARGRFSDRGVGDIH